MKINKKLIKQEIINELRERNLKTLEQTNKFGIIEAELNIFEMLYENNAIINNEIKFEMDMVLINILNRALQENQIKPLTFAKMVEVLVLESKVRSK